MTGLNNIIDSGVGLQCPDHIREALDHLRYHQTLLAFLIFRPDTTDIFRQNAEDDLSNILHIQSTLPSSVSRPAPGRHPVMSPTRREEAAPCPGHLGQRAEGRGPGQLSLADDDMFTLDGVTGSQSQSNAVSHIATLLVLTARSPAALSPSDEDREEADSEPDEGIHIPGKFRQNKPLEVAASLPVGIPWPAQLTAARGADRQRAPVSQGQPGESSERPSDIAASIQVSIMTAYLECLSGANKS